MHMQVHFDHSSSTSICSIDIINSIALTSDDRFLVSASYDHSIKVWNLHTRKLEYQITNAFSGIAIIILTRLLICLDLEKGSWSCQRITDLLFPVAKTALQCLTYKRSRKWNVSCI